MSDLFAIEGKHVLVTGASSGFGRHFALFLAGCGARVTVAARRAEAIDKSVQTIQADKGQGQGVVMDVTSTGSIDVALAAAEQGFGPVDVLINNAGVASTKAALEQAEADWDKVIDTNLKGVWLCSHSVGRRMAELKTVGSIVNIASILGLRVAGAVAPYAVSKAGSCR